MLWNTGLGQESETGFDDMSVPSFNKTILFACMGTRMTVQIPRVVKKEDKLLNSPTLSI
ncbi:hypothetical protein HanIR_Chr12g0601911 [Helianthus annuus]|nr:hypothetical protein HanIR_Chr12g0601911 [Helianthus annuus]